ncbi:Uma2 family endonuclease [Sandaracinus amylolyticus]|uniref:Putative restriction endonuclease domain-containing protein n=1 Tax=Sandaracinus amylolyticus TaxID=927083 RepID=A0A0F6W613_9BACT|nr:Uma2 family endonuclease [Sandaracinus amylolyticus]AKF08177.1 hypothetical protein DB32_005326 [Sandaracinus amylolyticus]
MEPARKTRFTEDEYLAIERASEQKHELIDGEIYATAGGTPRHALVSVNVATALSNALRDRPCVVLSSDQRVAVRSTGMYTYPDVTVVCGTSRFHDKDANTLINPTLIVEVLSSGTETHDRGAKLAHYRRLDSVQEVLLVVPEERRVETHRRIEGGQWISSPLDPASAPRIELASIDVALAWDDVYAKVELLG